MIKAVNIYDANNVLLGNRVLYEYNSLGFQKFDTVEVYNKEDVMKGFFISFKECTLSTPKTFKRLVIFNNKNFYIIEPEDVFTKTKNESGNSTMLSTRMVLFEKSFTRLDFSENTF